MVRLAVRRSLLLPIAAMLMVSACGSGGLLSESGGESEECAEIDLTEYADPDSAVRITMEGPIVAREDNRPVRIIVDASYRQLHILEGYDDAEYVLRERWENDRESYEEFMAALEFEGFTKCKEAGGDFEPDGTGACPKNRRMVAELYDEGIQQMRLWWADCDGGAGTLDGTVDTIQELFQAQIPEFETLTDGLEF